MRDDRLARSRDEHELFFQAHPRETDREYWLDVFDGLAKLPGAGEIFGDGLAVREMPSWLSGDAAGALLQFFQRVDATTGELVHDFADGEWDTRFLGDLYQQLSEQARKKYALLQTPEFVERFILDRTLEPAIDTFRAEFLAGEFRMIDPACGSGHFLLGGFGRLLGHWRSTEKSNDRVLVQRAIDGVFGVDVNPVAVSIARFRLWVAALRECGIGRLKDAPDFRMNVMCGDSLLHGEWRQTELRLEAESLAQEHYYSVEDVARLHRVLEPGRYHAVVANPPYIVPKDKALNEAYRKRYQACYKQYSLAVPFMEQIFNLAVEGGFTGQITANSFMKREFGKKLIESFLPTVDLTHVIDTSGAYIPGHGTPTVILFGRNRQFISSEIRTVMKISGEPGAPKEPAKGLVWSAILEQIDIPGSQSDFISASNSSRDTFHKHPWSIGGGGAAELKELIDESKHQSLNDVVTTISTICLTREDEAYLIPERSLARNRISSEYRITSVQGEHVRDWSLIEPGTALFPYDVELKPVKEQQGKDVHRFLWAYKELLWRRKELGGDHRQLGRTWWEWNRFLTHWHKVPSSITFACVATHNHFVLDRDNKVFNRSAPVIKLPSSATEADHLSLLGLLNSSLACFWMKQIFHCKGSTVDHKGARQATVPFEDFYDYDVTKLKLFPLPEDQPVKLSEELNQLASKLGELVPSGNLNANQSRWLQVLAQMIALQEELDWQCYQLYNLISEDLTYAGAVPPIALGQRAFEIVMARKMAAGELETTWFDRHHSQPITELPAEWSEDYKQLVNRRIELIERDRNIALIEQPEYKRRWNTEPWESQLDRALRNWLLDRLERYFDFDGRMCPHPQPPLPRERRSQNLLSPFSLGRRG